MSSSRPRRPSRRPLLSLRGYPDSLGAEPGCLDVVEERLGEYARVDRRYGPGIEQVIAAAERAREDLSSLQEAISLEERLQSEVAVAISTARVAADELHVLRGEGVPKLASGVEGDLADLAMPHAHMRIDFRRDNEPVPRSQVRFLLRVNPGMPEAPIAEAVSVGELSRLLLALHGLAAAQDDAPWVFDEVDAGVAGRTALAIASGLERRATRVQAVVITHLPNVAAAARIHGASHFSVVGERGVRVSGA